MNSLLFILASVLSFWTNNPSKASSVIEFFQNNPSVQEILERDNSYDDAIIGISIVAPEVAMNTCIRDFIEKHVMDIMYVELNSADYSIGPFQMKPSFAVFIENFVSRRNLKQFHQLKITASSEKEIRKIRIKRLSSLDWQTLYLSAFLFYVKDHTAHLKFASSTDKVKYWATLYNSKITSTQQDVYETMKSKQFPHYINRYNFADVAAEFYNILTTP